MSTVDRNVRLDPAFEREIEVVLQALRPALAGILEELRLPVMRAAELQRMLGLDKSLSWNVYNAATARDPWSLASLLPGRRAMERFFAASALHGVAPDAIERAREAFAQFEQSAARHAGSRDAFKMMVRELGGIALERRTRASEDLKHKRAAFRANSLLCGRQARVFGATLILHPSARAGLLDQVFIRGIMGLHRTRRAAPLHVMARRWRTVNPGDPSEPGPPQPLDPRERGPDAIGLLRDFCSQPLPRFGVVESQQGLRSHELMCNRLGPSGEVTYFIGDVTTGASVVPGSVPGSEVMLSKIIDVPMTVFVGDILIHKGVWDTRRPQVKVYSCRSDGSLEFRDSDLLPLTETAEYLGQGIDAARTPLIPRYVEMLSYTMEQTGWHGDEFRVFRCRVEYPMLHSRIRLTLR